MKKFYPILFGSEIKIWSLFVSCIFIIVAFLKPAILKYFYFVWIKVGNVIGSIISKIVLLFLFYFIFTTVSIFLKLLGKDLLRKKILLNKKSYWIQRNTQVNSMKKQF